MIIYILTNRLVGVIMKSILLFFIIFAVVIHGFLDIFDEVHWINRLINLCFLFIFAVITHFFIERGKNKQVK